MLVDDTMLLKVQYNWVFDIVKRMEVVVASQDKPEEKLQQLEYLIKQALKAEKPND